MNILLISLLTTPLATAPEAPPVSQGPGFDLSAAALSTLLAEDPPPEVLGVWKGTVAAGGSVSDGNTHRKSGNASANAEKRREKDRITLDFLWNYAEENGQTTQRRTFGSAKYDYFLTKKAYLLGQASGENDYAAQLLLRTTLGAGAGYQFLEDERWKLSGEAGLAWVDENSKDNTIDGSFIAARFAYKAAWKPSEPWTVGQTGEIYPSLEDTNDTSARVDTTAKVLLSKKMFAQFQWLFTWDNTPAAGAKRTDELYLLALGWSF